MNTNPEKVRIGELQQSMLDHVHPADTLLRLVAHFVHSAPRSACSLHVPLTQAHHSQLTQVYELDMSNMSRLHVTSKQCHALIR